MEGVGDDVMPATSSVDASWVVHVGEGPGGSGGDPCGVGSHGLIAVVEAEQQIALDRLA